jgi:hypothetical protein
MDWLVENARVLYILLGIVGVGLVLVWWNNRRAKYLGFVVGIVALIGLLWLLTQFHISDRKQIELNVLAMRDAILKKNADDLFKHVSKDFNYKGTDRETLYAAVKVLIGKLDVSDIGISSFRVEDVSREKKLARTSFLVTPHPDKQMFRAEADFVLEGDQWKLKTMRFYGPTGGQEMDIPGLLQR